MSHRSWVGLFVGAVAVAGCSSGIGRPVREVTAVTASDGVQHVRITTHSFWFEPNRIVVKRGVPVEIRAKNGAFFVPHNVTCVAPAAGIDVHANVGMFRGSSRARFTPTEPGEYPFFCGVDAHAKKGMTGTLVVTP